LYRLSAVGARAEGAKGVGPFRHVSLPARTADNSLPRSNRALLYAKDINPATYWQKKFGDMDYDEEDKLDSPRFNRELWIGMMARKPYPQIRSGKNLRENRTTLLRKFGILDN